MAVTDETNAGRHGDPTTAQETTDTGAGGGPSTFRVLPVERCYELLGTTVVGRVAFAGRAGLQLLPVNYRIFEGTVLLSTSPGSTLSELADHRGEVVFEVDYHAPVARHGWSVIVRGTSRATTDPRTLGSPERRRLTPWVPTHEEIVVQIHADQVTGRDVTPFRRT